MKVKTLLVDSNYLLKRSIHGAKNVYTPSFGHIGGLYQFMTTLRKLIKENQINKVILAWDGENGGIYRYNLDHAYKANREGKNWSTPIELSPFEIKRENEKKISILKQRKRVQTYAEELFLRQIEVEDIEADDLIAAYCYDNHNKEDIVIYTNDRDFCQLLHLNIKIKFANIDIIIDKDSFFFNFAYDYKNSLTMKIIEGDHADNIAGIKLLKEKTLLEHFPELAKRYVSVREICIKADKINKERITNKKKPLKSLLNLTENIDRLKLNYELIDLSNPLLNEEAEEELKQLDIPLSSKNRGAKNLVKLMNEDQFMTVYGGNFVNYVEPFYPVIMNEKKLLKDFIKREKKIMKG